MTNQTINTIEELTTLACNPYKSDRYMFELATHSEFVDKDAGDAWYKEHYDANEKFCALAKEQTEPHKSYWDLPEYKEYEKAHSASKPAERLVRCAWLRCAGRHSASDHLLLGEELGKQIEAIWKTKPNKYSNSKDYVGAISLKTILIRLGQTEIGTQIEQARNAVKERQAKNLRNNARRNVREALMDLEKRINAASNSEIGLLVAGDFSTMTPKEILVIIGEDEV